MLKKLKKTARLTVYGVAIAVTLAGCADVFGLSGYSFDEAAAIDAGVEASSMADVIVVATTDAQDSAMGIDSAPPAPSCTDKTKNGSETDIDCGGMCTTKCAAKKECLLSSDCQTKLACVDLLCLSPSSNDGVLDGTETDVDCGGPSAPACGTGKMCVMAVRDCLSEVCTGGVCAAPSPTDGIQNGAETDVDCGGGTAPVCVDLKHCVDGFRDCASRVCTNLACHPPTASDGYKNGTETDVDCGGGTAPTCIVGKVCVVGSRDCTSLVCTAGTCASAAPSDGVKNGTETDIDCGGGAAPACVDGQMCAVGTRDCTSKVCTGGVCKAPTFSDGVQNGTETDVDCGGSNGAPLCVDGKACAIGTRDCTSFVCGAAGSCQVPSPTDGVKNGTETDVDCGGGNGAPACVDGKACITGPRDCTSKVCTGKVCQAPTNMDGVSNGTETDIDCGGGNGAPRCLDGRLCVQGPRDCTSLVCAGTCQAPTINDGVKNGSETDVDCGGGAAPACIVGKVCVVGSRDCTSLVCSGGTCAAPAPNDGVKNGTETDIDCGGGAAPACVSGLMCAVGTRDCTSKVCTGGVCKAPTFIDGVQNGTETDVDCGGGNGAPACADGKACAIGTRDCTSLVCGVAGSCQAPTTNDGVKNGTETDVDCGGSAGAPKCADGQMCVQSARDCTSKVCTGGICQVPTFIDGVKNGTETDIDCGGGNGAPACIDGKTCAIGTRDCTSLVCGVAGTCQSPTTNDGVKNGTETDIDCGGSAGAPKCADGQMCVQSARDCTSKVCTGGICQVPTFIDGVKNGTETDIDCGGGNGAPLCADGLACVDAARDCMSPNCAGGVCAP